MKLFYWTVVLLGLICISVLAYRSSYVPFVPMTKDLTNTTIEIHQHPEMDTPEFQKHFIGVLANALEPHEVRDGKIFIQRSLASDPMTLADYVMTAERETNCSCPKPAAHSSTLSPTNPSSSEAVSEK
jgi:hypothetical protein